MAGLTKHDIMKELEMAVLACDTKCFMMKVDKLMSGEYEYYYNNDYIRSFSTIDEVILYFIECLATNNPIRGLI